MISFWKKLNPFQALLLTLCFSAVVALAGITTGDLESGDETRVAGISAEMYLGGDYLTPHLNGQAFLEYPPLYYWLDCASFAVFGVTDWAARLPAALAGILCALTAFAFAARLKFPPWAAFLAGVMTLTGAQTLGNLRKCMVDPVLTWFILLTVFAFYAMLTSKNTRAACGWFALSVLAMAGGIMTKGLIGAIFPVAAIGIWLVGRGILEKRLAIGRYFALGFVLAFACLLAGIWYFLLYRRCGYDMLHTVLIVNNFGRASGTQGDHNTPLWFYLAKLPTLFWPWLPLYLAALWFAVRDLKKLDPGRLLVLSFAVIPFFVLSAASAKRVVYLLPLYPAWALLSAGFLANLSLPERWEKRLETWKPSGGKGWTALLTAAAVGLTAFSAYRTKHESLRGLFKYCQDGEKEGFKTVLTQTAHPKTGEFARSERTAGAAYFYLGHAVEERRADARMDQPAAGELWIGREKLFKRPGILKFSDGHFLLRGAKNEFKR